MRQIFAFFWSTFFKWLFSFQIHIFCVVWSLKLLSLDLRELDSFAFLTSCRTLLAHLVSYFQSVLWVELKVKEIGFELSGKPKYSLWNVAIECLCLANCLHYILHIFLSLSFFLFFFFCVSLIRLNVKMEQILTKLGWKIEALRASSPHPRQYLLWAID